VEYFLGCPVDGISRFTPDFNGIVVYYILHFCSVDSFMTRYSGGWGCGFGDVSNSKTKGESLLCAILPRLNSL